LPEDDERLWPQSGKIGDRQSLLKAIDHSLRYLQTARAATAYQRQYARTGITRSHVRRSLIRFRSLLRTSRSGSQLRAALKREFLFYQPAAQSGPGAVAFTGYYQPIYAASRVRNATYRYPLYRLPPYFSRWSRPHPTRSQLEGLDGLHPAQPLRGMELVWLRDRLQAYLVQVEGSARLRLTNGRYMTVGYAGSTDRPYTGIGRELVKDGKVRFEDLTQQFLIEYFRYWPQELSLYLPRNQRFVFFRETHGAPPSGSIGVPLTAERSIATDKLLMPPGALALIQVQVSNPYAANVLKTDVVTRYVLDQDAGSAIKGPNRVDVYMGTGTHAGERAGVINSTGRLYYLLLRKL
jgi:membrane-bound lytic murein transglycosylase A